MRTAQLASFFGTSFKGSEAQPVVGGDAGPGWSMVAGSIIMPGGTGTYLSVANGGDWALGTGDFTIEWWQWVDTTVSNNRVWSVGYDTGASIGFSFESGGTAYVWLGGGAAIIAGMTDWQQRWNHMALVRSNGVLKLYQNGISFGGGVSNSTNISDAATALQIGSNGGSTISLHGHITDFHWCKGYAKYTNNFTPPTSQISALPSGVTGDHPVEKDNSGTYAWLKLADYPDAAYIPVGATVTSTGWLESSTVTSVSTTASAGYMRLGLDPSHGPYAAGTTYTVSWQSQTKLLIHSNNTNNVYNDSSSYNKTVDGNGNIQWDKRGPYLSPLLYLNSLEPESYSGTGSTWHDLGRKGNDATLFGSYAFSAGIMNLPVGAYASGLDLGTLSQWTINAWINVNQTQPTGEYPAVFTNKHIGSTIAYCMGFPTDPNSFGAGYYDGAWHTAETTVPTPGVWYNFTATYDGSTMKLYRNGTLASSVAVTGSSISSGDGYYVGRRWDTANYMDSKIPVVQLYDRALTAGEVATIYSGWPF